MSSSAVNMARMAKRENTAVRRAVESLGLKVHFSTNTDDGAVSAENQKETLPRFSYSPIRESDRSAQVDDKSDLSVSVTVLGDEASQCQMTGVCESLCPFRPDNGMCRWPESGCAQLRSQFIGMKANLDAFDRMSIFDGYFKSERQD